MYVIFGVLSCALLVLSASATFDEKTPGALKIVWFVIVGSIGKELVRARHSRAAMGLFAGILAALWVLVVIVQRQMKQSQSSDDPSSHGRARRKGRTELRNPPHGGRSFMSRGRNILVSAGTSCRCVAVLAVATTSAAGFLVWQLLSNTSATRATAEASLVWVLAMLVGYVGLRARRGSTCRPVKRTHWTR